jgi:hypothetical protein
MINQPSILTGEEILKARGQIRTAEELINLIRVGLPAYHGSCNEVEVEPGVRVNAYKQEHRVSLKATLDPNIVPELLFQVSEYNRFMETCPRALLETMPAHREKLREDLLADFYNSKDSDTPELLDRNQHLYNLTGENVLDLPVVDRKNGIELQTKGAKAEICTYAMKMTLTASDFKPGTDPEIDRIAHKHNIAHDTLRRYAQKWLVPKKRERK